MGSNPTTIEDLMALNDELLALVSAGVPLERGLVDAARVSGGRLRHLSQSMADDLQQGKSLTEVLEVDDGTFPPVYRAVVAAGIEAGNLAAALEHLAVATRRLHELRRVVGMALLYPLLVLAVACQLFSVFGPRWTAAIRDAIEFHHVDYRWGMPAVLDAIDFVTPAVWVLPWALIGTAILWWIATGWTIGAEPRRASWLFAWVPWLGALLRKGQAAVFCETAAMLIEYRLPLDRAISLAARTTGDAKLLTTAETLASRMRQGERLAADDPALRVLPPLTRWMLAGKPHHTMLAQGLKTAAEDYRRMALRLAERVRLFFPIGLTFLLGGLVTVFYTLAVFVPWSGLMTAIGEAF